MIIGPGYHHGCGEADDAFQCPPGFFVTPAHVNRLTYASMLFAGPWMG